MRKQVVIAFRKYKTSHGLPTLPEGSETMKISENLKVLVMDLLKNRLTVTGARKCLRI